MTTRQQIISRSNDNPDNLDKEYCGICSSDGGDFVSSSKQTHISQVIPRDGTLSDLRVRLINEPGSGNSFTFTILKNGSSTNLSVTISGTDTTGENLTDEVSVSAGDLVVLESDPDSAPTTGDVLWSVQFKNSTNNESIVLGNTNAVDLDQSAIRYLSVSGQSSPSTTEEPIQAVISQSGYFKNFYVKLDSYPGSGNSFTFTLRKNGSDTAISVTISGTDTTGSDTTNSVYFNEGDKISIKATPTSNPYARSALWGIVFESDTQGYGNVLSNSDDGMATNSDEWISLFSNRDTQWGTSATDRGVLTHRQVIKKLFVSLSQAPDSGGSYTFRVCKDGTDTDLAVTLSGSDTTGSDTTEAHYVYCTGGEVLTLKSEKNNITTAGLKLRWGVSASVDATINTKTLEETQPLTDTFSKSTEFYRTFEKDNIQTMILRPTSDSSVDFTPSSGSDNYAMVDEEVADDDSTYNYSTGDYRVDYFQKDSIDDNLAIQKVRVTARVKTDRLGDKAELLIKLGSYGSGKVFDLEKDVWETISWDFNSKPGGGEWTAEDVNNLIFGYSTGSGTGEHDGNFHFTQCYLTVYYYKDIGLTGTHRRILNLTRKGIENTPLSDVYQRLPSIFNRRRTFPLPLIDTLKRTINLTKYFSSITNLTDTFRREWIVKRIFLENFSISDSFRKFVVYKRIFDELLPLSDNFSRSFILNRTFLESMNLNEAFSLSKILNRTKTENLSLTQTFKRKIIKNIQSPEDLTISDVFNKFIIYKRVIENSFSLNDSFQRNFKLTKTFQQELDLSDALNFRNILNRDKSESVSLSSEFKRSVVKNINIQEDLSMSDNYSDVNQFLLDRKRFQNPKYLWRLDDDLGNKNVIEDINGNFGTTVQNTEDMSVSGKIDKGLFFNGIDDYISLDRNVVLDLEHSSLSFWIKRNNVNYESIFGKGDNVMSLLEIDKNDEEGHFYFEPDINNRQMHFVTGLSLDDNEWHHIVFVFDKNASGYNRVKLYVDGELSVTTERSDWTDTFTFNKIGHQESQNTYVYGEYYYGSLDDIMVFDRALSSNEVKDLYPIINLKDNFSRKINLNLNFTENFELNENLIKDIEKQFYEYFSLTDSFFRKVYFNKEQNETLSLEESFIKNRVRDYVFEDSFNLNDAFYNPNNIFNRRTIEYLPLIDSYNNNLNFLFLETLNLVESNYKNISLTKEYLDSFVISDSFIRKTEIKKDFNEDLSITWDFYKKSNLIRNLSDSISLYDYFSNGGSQTQIFYESLQLEGSFNKNSDLFRTHTGTLGIGEEFNKKFNLTKILLDSLNLIYDYNRKINLEKELLEELFFEDIFSKRLNIFLNNIEFLNLIETHQRGSQLYRRFTNNLSLNEDYYKETTYVIEISKSLNIQDSFEKSGNYSIALLETLNLLDHFVSPQISIKLNKIKTKPFGGVLSKIRHKRGF